MRKNKRTRKKNGAMGSLGRIRGRVNMDHRHSSLCVCVCVSRWPGDVSIQMNYKSDKSDSCSLYNNQVKAKLTVKDYDQNRRLFRRRTKECIKINTV